MTRRSRRSADVAYVGFVLGHGGDAVQMLGLAKGVQERGARVRIIVPALETSVVFAARCEEAGVECERTDLITADMHASRQKARSVIALFRSIDAPIVHFHTGGSCLPRVAMLSLELLRYRRGFVTLHSPYETLAPGSSRARFWATTAARRFQAVASPSDHGTRFQLACGIPPGLAVTVRNGIDVSAMAHGDASRARAALGVPSEAPIVLFTSRIDGQKRPVDAVRIFAGVADEFPSAVLVFAGTGDEEAAVQAEADRLRLDDRVRLVGYQSNIRDWLAAATVWVLPTERENFSIAVLEALAAGCSMLATSCPGNDEILVDDDNALTFPVGAVDEATRKLRQLLVDPGLCRRLSDRARATADSCSVERMVDNYVALYANHPDAPAALRR